MMNPQKAHLIGIGGTGLSAIARVLLERGWSVSGSDRLMSPLAESLQTAGARILIGHSAENIQGADLIICSSAISDDNVEIAAARAAHIPVYKRSEFLEKLITGQRCVAVAGSHGKTTTTAMIAWMLYDLGLDPSYIIGSVSANLGSNAHAGQGSVFVIEADEYDRMFLGLQPEFAIVTNVEHDHPDCYPEPEDFYQAFLAFAQRVPTGGKLLICADDPGGLRLLQETRERGQQVLSYGMENTRAALDYQAENFRVNDLGYQTWEAHCTLPGSFNLTTPVNLQVPGEHNVRNALAALAVAHQLALPLEKAALALSEYKGTHRRFEIRGEVGGIILIDDYAHHPTEIRTTLTAARQRYPNRQLWAVWQPHTYSRTRLLADDFAHAFDQADWVIVTEVYASRETPPSDGFSALCIAEMMTHPGKHFAASLPEATMLLLEYLHPGDILIVFSAGDADQINTQILEALRKMEENHA
jgi:UDP-N-acetylmuramate--alanine ligase